jgi:O-acetyl-ADP-ribose deacetylase
MEFAVAEGRSIALVEGDIARVAADAAVNAANSALVGGAGVNGAMLRAGGPELVAELERARKTYGGCPTGSAVVTGGGALPVRWVVHAVGPIYRDGASGEAEMLASCYREALRLAGEAGARTVTMPSISTGVYGYPMAEAAAVALAAVADFLRAPDCPIERATFVLFGREAFDIHAEAARRLLG